jgi:hypothetical protein
MFDFRINFAKEKGVATEWKKPEIRVIRVIRGLKL